MKKIVMIAAMKYSKSDGISKKICMQASGLSSDGNKGNLFCLGENGIVKLEYDNGVLVGENLIASFSSKDEGIGGINEERDLLRVSMKFLNEHDVDMLYVRHMLPDMSLLQLLRIAHNKKIKIGYEIPTYPYYREQMNVSKNKLKTFVKLGIETVYWPLIYKNIDVLTVIRCSTKAKMFKKMLSITNGFAGGFQEYIPSDLNNINMIGVGTIYTYHGYEKVIRNMEKCGCRTSDGALINFHIVGQSGEIDRLKNIVRQLELEDHVFFHGVKHGEELKEIYRECNLGVGTMALSLRNADIDTAIKNIEYWSMNLPVMSSGSIFEVNENTGLYYKQNEKNSIDFDSLSMFIQEFYMDSNKLNTIANVLDGFTWFAIMHYVVAKLKEE